MRPLQSMDEEKKNLNKTPSKMARLTWPKSKYGVYAAIIIIVIIWIGWTVISSRQESDKLEKLARRKPSSNAWKSNITDG